MSDDRLDALLGEALETGIIPPRATPGERAAIEPLLAIARAARAAAAQVDREAGQAMPIARARFERTMAAARGSHPVTVVRPERRGFFGGLLSLPRPALSASAIGLLALAVLAGVALTGPLGQSGETAYAAVLEPGNYVEVQGVVASTEDTPGGRRLALETPAGKLRIEVSSAGTIVDGADSRPVSSIKPGDALSISGVVGKDRAVAAEAVARSAAGTTPPAAARFQELRQARGEIAGRVISVILSPDGKQAHVLIDGGPDRRFGVNVDRTSAERLLGSVQTIGLEVKVTPGDRPGAPFILSVPTSGQPGGSSPGNPPESPSSGTTSAQGEQATPEAEQSPRISGVATAHTGDRLRVEVKLAVRSETVTVVIEPRTRIFVSPQGPGEADIRGGKASLAGFQVAFAGPRDREGVTHAAILIVGRPVR